MVNPSQKTKSIGQVAVFQTKSHPIDEGDEQPDSLKCRIGMATMQRCSIVEYVEVDHGDLLKQPKHSAFMRVAGLFGLWCEASMFELQLSWQLRWSKQQTLA
jgi:hypothetical protein